MRIDRYLFENGFAKSPARASAMIAEGSVTLNGVHVTKPSLDVSESDNVEICGEVLRYVSRGGLKLEAAISAFHLNVSDCVAVDIGASTGGFTD